MLTLDAIVKLAALHSLFIGMCIKPRSTSHSWDGDDNHMMRMRQNPWWSSIEDAIWFHPPLGI